MASPSCWRDHSGQIVGWYSACWLSDTGISSSSDWGCWIFWPSVYSLLFPCLLVGHFPGWLSVAGPDLVLPFLFSFPIIYVVRGSFSIASFAIFKCFFVVRGPFATTSFAISNDLSSLLSISLERPLTQMITLKLCFFNRRLLKKHSFKSYHLG